MGLTRPRAHQLQDSDFKQSVRAISTTSVTLSGGAPATVDGVSLSENDRILVTGQSTGSENGIYVVTTVGSGSNGTWTRSPDADTTGDMTAGLTVMVTEGTSYADTTWKITTNDPITLDTTSITFAQASAYGYGTIAVSGQSSIVADQVGDTLTVAAGNNISLTTTAGSDTLTVAVSDSINTSGTITATGNITGGNLVTSGTVTLDRLALSSSQTTVPPLQLTANSLNDGVGALRIDGSQADIYLNPSTATHTTVTFAVNDDQRLAFGMDNNSDFYITRRTSSTWYDDTFVLDRDTGLLSLGYGATVAGTLTYSTLNDGTTALTSTVAELNLLDGVTGITLGNANELLVVGSDGTSIVTDSVLTIDADSNYIGINQTSPEVTLHMTGEAAQSAQIRMEQMADTADAPDIRTRKSRGTAAAPTKNSAGDFIYRQNHERYNGTGWTTVGQLAVDTNSSNADRFQLTLTVSEDGSSIDAADHQFKIDGNDGGAITFNGAYKFPTSDGTVNQVLQTNGSGILTFADQSSSGLSDVVDDTTPQLGGDLDLNSNNITGTGGINTTGTITATGNITGGNITTAGTGTFGTMTDGTVSFTSGNISGVDELRIDQSGTGLRMTNVGAFDNDGSDNFRIFSTNDLKIAANGENGTAITIDATNQDVTVTNDLSVAGDATVTGNLTVNGTTTTVSSTNTVITDNLIELNNGAASNANDSGIVIERGSTGDNAFMGWDESADSFILGTTTATGASTGDLTISAAPLSISSLTLGGTAVTATATELNYVDGVTSAIQTQLDSKGTGTVSSLSDLSITATATELNYVDGVTSAIQTQLNGKQATITGGATTITGSNLTVSRALVSDGSGKVAVSAVTSTELGYLDGVTSAIQTQLNTKVENLSDLSITATAAELNKLDGVTATTTELNYVDGVTSNIQTQLNGKQASGTYNTVIGTDTDIDTSGATIIDNLYMTDGVITSHGTRTLTLADLGYTGATNANYITNNNQLTNGAGYITSSGTAANATNATNFNVAADNSTNANHYVIFTGGASGNQRPNSDTGLLYNPSTNTLTTTNFAGTSTSAKYADLAENYIADADYEPGTVLIVGGEKEVTVSTEYASPKLAGIVTTAPAYLMNSALDADNTVGVALVGRVPCKITGTIEKGDLLTSSSISGVATKLQSEDFVPGCILGKALENYSSNEVGTIEVLVGKI